MIGTRTHGVTDTIEVGAGPNGHAVSRCDGPSPLSTGSREGHSSCSCGPGMLDLVVEQGRKPYAS
ncbi:hypothetical protein ACFSNO_10260 [Streptomyces cirratus]